MDTEPAMSHPHPEPDSRQRVVIAHTGGPLPIIAGPGTVKTSCVALRAVNLLLTDRAVTEGLALSTFGRDAALDLKRRFLQTARACGVRGGLFQVSVSTIRTRCHHILVPHAGLVGLRPGYGFLNQEEQPTLLRQEFVRIFGPGRDTLSVRGWRDGGAHRGRGCQYFERI